MSSIYIQEPVISGRVLMRTNYGDLEIELWCKETPLACRNFIQLAQEGYYDKKILNRVIPGFCVQGGVRFLDDAGHVDVLDGGEGDSVFGREGFAIESHSRIRFNRRGMLAMVPVASSAVDSRGEKMTRNHAELFFTLDAAPELNKMNTIFGKVVGNSVFNLLKMGELEVDTDTERPIYPPIIEAVEVLEHPFQDMAPRAKKTHAAEVKEEKKSQHKDVKKKNLRILSFADEDVSQETSLVRPSIAREKSVLAKPKDLPTEGGVLSARESKLSEIKQEISRAKREIKKLKQTPAKTAESTPATPTTLAEDSRLPATLLQQERLSYLKGKNVLVGRRPKTLDSQYNTLAALSSFKSRLSTFSLKDNVKPRPKDDETKAKDEHPERICKLHSLCNCKSCFDSFAKHAPSADDREAEEGWLDHELVFEKEAGERDVKLDPNELVVIDPREKSEKLVSQSSLRKK